MRLRVSCPQKGAHLGDPTPPPRAGGALTGFSGGHLSFSSSSWEGATPSCWTSAWSWVTGGGTWEWAVREEGRLRPPSPQPSPPRRALTCTPGARGSRRPGSRSPPGRRPRPRARTPGPAQRPRAAAGSPPRCWRQGRSPPAPQGWAFRPLPGSQCSTLRPGPPARSAGCCPQALEGQAGIWATQRAATLAGARPQRGPPHTRSLLWSHLSVSPLLLGVALPSPIPSPPFMLLLCPPQSPFPHRAPFHGSLCP